MYTCRLAWPQYFGMLGFLYFSSKCSQGSFIINPVCPTHTYITDVWLASINISGRGCKDFNIFDDLKVQNKTFKYKGDDNVWVHRQNIKRLNLTIHMSVENGKYNNETLLQRWYGGKKVDIVIFRCLLWPRTILLASWGYNIIMSRIHDINLST